MLCSIAVNFSDSLIFFKHLIVDSLLLSQHWIDIDEFEAIDLKQSKILNKFKDVKMWRCDVAPTLDSARSHRLVWLEVDWPRFASPDRPATNSHYHYIYSSSELKLVVDHDHQKNQNRKKKELNYWLFWLSIGRPSIYCQTNLNNLLLCFINEPIELARWGGWHRWPGISYLFGELRVRRWANLNRFLIQCLIKIDWYARISLLFDCNYSVCSCVCAVCAVCHYGRWSTHMPGRTCVNVYSGVR